MAIITYSYWCLNPECPHDGVNKKNNIPVVKDEGEVDKEEQCPYCSSPMKLQGQLDGFASFNRFNSLSSEGKQAILKKRAHKHFKKEIEEQKADIQKKNKPGII